MEGSRWSAGLVCGLLCLLTLIGASNEAPTVKGVATVTFLLTVNDTWYPQEYGKQCIQTVKSPPLQPNKTWSESETIHVGDCDYGPLIYTVYNELIPGKGGSKEAHTYIDVIFDSHVIEDASHPECRIQWDYSYLVPTTYGVKESLLPGCFVMDSREGYHMTYYWFHVLDWVLF